MPAIRGSGGRPRSTPDFLLDLADDRRLERLACLRETGEAREAISAPRRIGAEEKPIRVLSAGHRHDDGGIGAREVIASARGAVPRPTRAAEVGAPFRMRGRRGLERATARGSGPRRRSRLRPKRVRRRQSAELPHPPGAATGGGASCRKIAERTGVRRASRPRNAHSAPSGTSPAAPGGESDAVPSDGRRPSRPSPWWPAPSRQRHGIAVDDEDAGFGIRAMPVEETVLGAFVGASIETWAGESGPPVCGRGHPAPLCVSAVRATSGLRPRRARAWREDGGRSPTYPGHMARSPLTLAASVTSALPRVGVVGAGALTEDGAGRFDTAVADLDDGRRVVVRVPADPDAASELAAEVRALRALTPGVRGTAARSARPSCSARRGSETPASSWWTSCPGYRVDAGSSAARTRSGDLRR